MSEKITPYERLAGAIVSKAVDDYRYTLRKLKKYPRNYNLNGQKEELLRFFRSDWFTQLTDIDSEMLIHKINEEINNYER